MKVKKRTIIIWILVGVILLSSLGVFLYKKISETQKGIEPHYRHTLYYGVFAMDNGRLVADGGGENITVGRNFNNKIREFCVPKTAKKTERVYSLSFTYEIYNQSNKTLVEKLECLVLLGSVDCTQPGETNFTVKKFGYTFNFTVEVVCADTAGIWFPGTTFFSKSFEGKYYRCYRYDKPEGYSLPNEMCAVPFVTGLEEYDNIISIIPRERIHYYMSDFSKFDGEKFVGCSFDLENQAPGIYKVRVTLPLNDYPIVDHSTGAYYLKQITEDSFYEDVVYADYNEYIILIIE